MLSSTRNILVAIGDCWSLPDAKTCCTDNMTQQLYNQALFVMHEHEHHDLIMKMMLMCIVFAKACLAFKRIMQLRLCMHSRGREYAGQDHAEAP